MNMRDELEAIELAEIDDSSHVGDFVEITLHRVSEITKHLDNQINIGIGISTAVFAFATSVLEKSDYSPALFVMMIFSAVSALAGLLAVHPPAFMRKRDQEESLMYRKKIESFKTAEDYRKAITAASASKEAIWGQYAKEIYNVCKYYYRPKRKLFHLSRQLLFWGIALSLFVFLVTFFVGFN